MKGDERIGEQMQCIITITSHQNDRRTKGGRRAQLNSLCCAIDTMTLVLILIDHVIVAHEHDHDYPLVLFLYFFLSFQFTFLSPPPPPFSLQSVKRVISLQYGTFNTYSSSSSLMCTPQSSLPARISRRRILPDPDLGICDTNFTSVSHLYSATRAAT